MAEQDERDYAPLAPRQIFLLIASLLLGVAIALSVAPLVFRLAPTDLTRIGAILDALNSPPEDPDYVIFGNSVAREGLDTRTISRQIPGEPVGFNFGSPAQTLVEASLYFQELPDSVNTVILGMSPLRLKAKTTVPDQKYNAFYMYGYRPTDSTIASLEKAYKNQLEFMEKSAFEQRFQSRWAARQMLDTTVRMILRKDLELESATYELYFPSAYAAPFSEAKFQIHLRTFYGEEPLEFGYEEQPVIQLKEMIRMVEDGGRRFVLLLYPINPRAYSRLNDGFIDDANNYFARFADEQNIKLINAIEWLPADMFIDAVHTSVPGAQELSRRVGLALAEEH